MYDDFEDSLEMSRALLGGNEGTSDLWEANDYANRALRMRPGDAEAWMLKCQILSALEDDPAALAAAEMALRRAPERAECLYWHGAVLGDLGRRREALRSIEAAFRVLTDDDHWMLEDLYYEKATVLEALGLHDAAVATCEAGLRRCPGSPLLRAALVPAERARVRSSLKVLRGGQA